MTQRFVMSAGACISACIAACTLACTLGTAQAQSPPRAATAPVTIGFEGIVVLASRQEIGAILMRSGLSAAQVAAEPLLVKLPDVATRQNVTARFTFTDDRLTDLLFTVDSDDPQAVRVQAVTWGTALRKVYGAVPIEASTSPEGYQVEGWCLTAGVEVSVVTRGSLAVLDYTFDEFGACRDAATEATRQKDAFMYRLPAR
jgi:hypothetical protein